MARPTTEQRLAAVHRDALSQFDRIQSSVSDERKQCLDDRRFVSIPGAMWEGPLGAQFENKPKFEVNKVMLSLIRIYNEYRNNRITVDFVPKDGTEGDKTADTCDGLYRADEQDSCAEEAYDNAFEEGTSGGIGAWRLRACYEDEDDDENEYQRIRMEPIYDADTSVFFDLDAKRQNKSDAKFAYVLSSISRDAYEAEWNDDPTTWPKDITGVEFDWSTPDIVYIAEYYRVEQKRVRTTYFRTVDGQEEKYTDEELIALVDGEDATVDDGIEFLRAIGTVKTKDRMKAQRKVRKYIMSGGRVLEDCGYIAGKYIPIIPYYGKRWFIDNVERCMGQVRLAKDAQRLKNMQLSKLGEVSALSSVSKPILTPEQIAGHQIMWSEDNLKNYPYLLINQIEGPDGQMMASGPVAYTKPPEIPQALAALLQITEQDMAEILGNQQNGEKMVSNISGKAVEMIQQRLDMQAFIYMSNFAKAMKWCGEVWLCMARELYADEGRKMKTVGTMGQASNVEIMKPVIDEDTGAVAYENNLSDAKYDVVVDVGPSFTSRRDATVRALTGMMQATQDPETLQVLSATAMMNMEGEGIDEVRDFFRQKLVGMGVIKPTPEEQQAMQEAAANQQPSAQDQYLAAAAKEADAKATGALAGAEKSLADAEKSKADAAETLAGIPLRQQEAALEAAKAINESLKPEPPTGY